jgi:hypothetical protein
VGDAQQDQETLSDLAYHFAADGHGGLGNSGYNSTHRILLCSLVNTVIAKLRRSCGDPLFFFEYYGLPQPVCALASQ